MTTSTSDRKRSRPTAESIPPGSRWNSFTLAEVKVQVQPKHWAELHEFVNVSRDELPAATSVSPLVTQLLETLEDKKVASPFDRTPPCLFDLRALPRIPVEPFELLLRSLASSITALVMHHEAPEDFAIQLLRLCGFHNEDLSVTTVQQKLDFRMGRGIEVECRPAVTVTTGTGRNHPSYYLFVSVDNSPEESAAATDVEAQEVCSIIAAELCNRRSVAETRDRAPIYMLAFVGAQVGVYRSGLDEQRVRDLGREGQCTETGHIRQLCYADGSTKLNLGRPADRRTLFEVLTAARRAVMSWHETHD